ncbi:hypothetical protein F2Q70_00002809 [Brassica cretica]|uniref:Uncharacterized protein n=1 Tax=Brassica cretica TaxID=69181 RepID=A0A8S9IR28_BRACR|nr:hypothetical protein F2Q70_00002809 [Brassica cretica]
MVMKPPLATKMWRDTVGFGSRTNRVGTTRCRLRFALLGCVHVLLQVVLHRVRFLDHLYQNITPTRGPFRARRRLLLPCTTPSSLNQHHFRNGCPRRGLTLPIMVRWVCVYIGSNHDGTWYPRAAPWSSLTGEAILQLLWVPSVELLPHIWIRIWKQETRERRYEQIWNKETRELQDLTTTTNRLQPPPPPHGTSEEEGERREITEREKRETAQGRERARRLGFSASGNSLQSFASVSE